MKTAFDYYFSTELICYVLLVNNNNIEEHHYRERGGGNVESDRAICRFRRQRTDCESKRRSSVAKPGQARHNLKNTHEKLDNISQVKTGILDGSICDALHNPVQVWMLEQDAYRYKVKHGIESSIINRHHEQGEGIDLVFSSFFYWLLIIYPGLVIY
jgi:hypothetical protein